MVKFKTALIFNVLMLVIVSGTIFAAVPEGWAPGWSEIQPLSEASQLSAAPTVLKDSTGNLHVFWLKSVNNNSQIFHLKMDSQGVIIKPDIQLTEAGDWKIKNFKVLWTPDNTILILLEIINNGSYQIQSQTFDPVTFGLTEKKELLNFERPIQGLNGVFNSLGELNLIWADLSSSNYEIYGAQYTSDLMQLVPPVRLTSSSEVSISPNVAVDRQDNLHIIWNEFNGAQWDLKYQMFTGEGEPVSELQSLGKAIEYSSQIQPQIAIDSKNRVHLAVIHSSKGGFGIVDYNVYYYLIDSSNNFIVNDFQVSDHNGGYQSVSVVNLTLDEKDRAHIVWTDDMYGALNNLYAIVDGNKIVQKQMRLAVTSEGLWLPNLVLNQGDKHLFFMAFGSEGKYNMGYMNTIHPAQIVYLNRIGIDIKHFFSSFVYRLTSLIFFSGLGIIMNFVPLILAFLAIVLLDRWIKNIHWSLKFLLMVGIILLLMGTNFAAVPEAFSSFYELLSIGLSLAIIFVLANAVKLYFDDGMTLILLEVLWLYAFLFIMQIPAGHLLMG